MFATDEGKAYEAVSFAGGTGLEGDPYQIETAEQLNAVRNYLGAGIYFELTKYGGK
ncbi:hypothetical protein QNH28_29335 [Paenibacillus sp. G2S3]|uniref:hypothetical protein n=1 Tax=Paenibacillus sp. G2S3 TaxID=3047872 RepID=UPI0024C13E25|nr:hypothetical protein [Paenibacillus sp. G2S3]WHY19442.1 hypothetical protein QNH28_29335 [Paenibacillus sp. G2S3]